MPWNQNETPQEANEMLRRRLFQIQEVGKQASVLKELFTNTDLTISDKALREKLVALISAINLCVPLSSENPKRLISLYENSQKKTRNN